MFIVHSIHISFSIMEHGTPRQDALVIVVSCPLGVRS